jgi:hypothetical protein
METAKYTVVFSLFLGILAGLIVKFFRSVWVTAAAPVLAPPAEESLFPPPKTIDVTMIKRQLSTTRNFFIVLPPVKFM